MMVHASKEIIAKLEDIVNKAAHGLDRVAAKKMFGCHGLFANDNVFALVWKEGRIGVRLPDADAFAVLMGVTGAVPWKAGKMTMSHWVMVPTSMHATAAVLKSWVSKAHGLAISQVKEAKKAKKPKTVAGKAATKSATAGAKKKAVGKVTKTTARRKKAKN